MRPKTQIMIFLFVLAFMDVRGQDPNFSQYEIVKQYYNAAFTGTSKNIKAGWAYRNLWPNTPGRKFPGPLSTYMAYADFQLRNMLVGGLGAFVVQDFEGEGYLRYTSGGLLYSWHTSNRKVAIKPVFHFYAGFKLSINQISIDWSRLEFSDQFDPYTLGTVRPTAFAPNNNGKKTFFDLDFGMAAKFLLAENWSNEVSIAAAHLVRPDISLTGIETVLPMKFSGHYITSFPIVKSKKVFMSPKILVEQQDNFWAFTPGISIYYVKRINHKLKKIPLYIGVYYRNGRFADSRNVRSFIFNVGHNGYWKEKQLHYQVGFSYDATMVGLPVNNTFGAFELTATIVLNTKRLDKLNKICPDFEGSPLGPLD